ncbi:hypothetical protein [Fimbriimonas ginsengisoli]|uniref:Secreted protein n=1 Tax=Fimbriimonas ginsengisoli Gsoil 348 TaxID=661478 RepID=A0A068NS19_FIMGI|nr:hypothetical protein [Fimbriimonas ginsengisoli]AIE86241.1 hypothetical protein OP10G_2873 [Fimbriimonas ginsengisoli Gsoil 348]
MRKRPVRLLADLGLVAAAISVAAAHGCGPKDVAEETKPSQVTQNIPKEQADRIAADFKGWKPKK